jgi:hypothetical protein
VKSDRAGDQRESYASSSYVDTEPAMSELPIQDPAPLSGAAALEEEARRLGLRPVECLGDLARFKVDLWDSDEDLDEFLADVRASRDADVA